MDRPPLHPLRYRGAFAALACSLAILLWAYWTTLEEVVDRWRHDPLFAHGYLVPAFALVLLWARRDLLRKAKFQPSWLGLPVLLAAIGVRLTGAYYHFVWLDQIALLPCLAGIVLLVGGRAAWRWAWPAVLFSGFMIPLPYRLDVALAEPLRRIAALTSTFLLQTLGLPALAEGNVILLNDIRLDVVEACSGLRMLVIFFALSTAVALVVQRPLWERLLIGMSAVPIALASNVARITLTGILQQFGDSAAARAVFHDLAGWLMMPLALGLLWLELVVLKRLLIEPDQQVPRRNRALESQEGPGGAPVRTRVAQPSEAIVGEVL